MQRKLKKKHNFALQQKEHEYNTDIQQVSAELQWKDSIKILSSMKNDVKLQKKEEEITLLMLKLAQVNSCLVECETQLKEVSL